MKRNIIIGALLLILGFVIGILCRPKHVPNSEIVQIDTLVYCDTIREYYPVEISREVIDTILITVRDTIREKETLYVPVPIERKIYASDEYYAEVSGYRPSLDYIEVYPKTTIVTEKVTLDRERNSLGLGLDMDYINTISIPIYLEYSYLLHKNVEFSARLLYDIPTKQYGFGLGAKVGIGW